jgi:hypothetical protein
MEAHPFRQAFAARDRERLMSLLADDVSFHSPVISEPGFEGRDAAARGLAIALDVFKDAQYTHDLADDRSHLLVADARELGKPVKITWLLESDAAGKIREIWVMARPLPGLIAIVEAVRRHVANRALRSAMQALSKPLAAFAAVTDRAAARMVDELNRSTT